MKQDAKRTQIRMFATMGILILLTMSWAACIGDDGDSDDNDDTNGNDAITITINGIDLTIQGLFSNQTTVTITGSDGTNYTGIPLKDLIDLVYPTASADKEASQYAITAADGYTKNVTWTDITMGVLIEHDEDNTMTAFPHLPGKYRIRDVASIEPIATPTLEVNGWLYTWDQPFDKLDEITVQDNESNTYEGVPLSDLLNDTGLEDQATHNFTITASDDYSKNFTWDDMMNGILVKDGRKSVFPEKEKQFWVGNIVRIEVV